MKNSKTASKIEIKNISEKIFTTITAISTASFIFYHVFNLLNGLHS